MLQNTIIYLIGFPGVGKYTTAKALCAADSNIKLIDNHLINNPVFSVIALDGKTPLSQDIWLQTRKIRDIVLETIKTLSPPSYSFVFTNNLYDGDEEDQAIYDKIERLAKQRNATFVPITLSCDLEENKKRIVGKDRFERMKQTDPDTVEKDRQTYSEMTIHHPNTLKIDSSQNSPEQTAQIILKHAGSCQ